MCEDTKRSFEIKLERISDEGISVRFYSKKRCELIVYNVIAFNQQGEGDDRNRVSDYSLMKLNNSSDVKMFSRFSKPISVYRTLGFQVKDVSNKEMFSVRVPLNGDTVLFTRMRYV